MITQSNQNLATDQGEPRDDASHQGAPPSGSGLPASPEPQSVSALSGGNPSRGPAESAEPQQRLYLDLDGVMADFDAHFPATFGLDHRGMADDAMWQTINAHPSYFRDMPPCAGAVTFFRSIEHLRPIVLTACPKSNYPHVAKQKREWVREHLSAHVIVLPVLGGRHKPLFMQEAGDVLIDDWEKNIAAWVDAGGIGILHRSFEATRRDLAVLGFVEASTAARNDQCLVLRDVIDLKSRSGKLFWVGSTTIGESAAVVQEGGVLRVVVNGKTIYRYDKVLTKELSWCEAKSLANIVELNSIEAQLLAQGGEARSAETGTGSAVGEHPVAEGDAPPPPSPGAL